MRARVRGLLIVVRVLAPAIVLLVVALVSVATVGSIRDSARTYGSVVEVELEEAAAVFQDVGAALEGAGMFVSGLGDAIIVAVGQLGSVPNEVYFPPNAVSIPGARLADFGPLGTVDFPATTVIRPGALSFSVPGVQSINHFFSDVSVFSRQLGDDIGEELAKLVAVPEPIDTIGKATEVFAQDVRSSVVSWLWVVFIAALLAVVAYLASKMAFIIGEVQRGWALMRGNPAPPVTIASLHDQVGAIQEQLATLA